MGVSQQDTSLVGLAQHGHGKAQEGGQSLGNQYLPAKGVDRHMKADHRGQSPGSQPGGQHKPSARVSAFFSRHGKITALAVDRGSPRPNLNPPPFGPKGGLKAAEQVERVRMAIGGGIAAAGDPVSKARKFSSQSLPIQYFEGKPGLVALQPVEPGFHCRKLIFIQADFDASRARVGGVDTCQFLNFGVQLSPGFGRFPGPLRVGRKIRPLALNPDKAEIAARGAEGLIPFIQDNGGKAKTLQPESYG